MTEVTECERMVVVVVVVTSTYGGLVWRACMEGFRSGRCCVEHCVYITSLMPPNRS